MKKKGQLSGNIMSLFSVGIIIIALIVLLAFGAQIINNIGTGFTAGSTAANITGEGQKNIKTFNGYIPTIISVVIATIVIGLLVVGFMGLMRR